MSDTTKPAPATKSKGFSLLKLLLEGRAFFALIVIVAVFSYLSPNYFTASNFLIMASQVAIFGLLAIGLTGLAPDELRASLGEQATLAAILSVLTAHENDLVACADALQVPPDLLAAAARRLEGNAA